MCGWVGVCMCECVKERERGGVPERRGRIARPKERGERERKRDVCVGGWVLGGRLYACVSV